MNKHQAEWVPRQMRPGFLGFVLPACTHCASRASCRQSALRSATWGISIKLPSKQELSEEELDEAKSSLRQTKNLSIAQIERFLKDPDLSALGSPKTLCPGARRSPTATCHSNRICIYRS